MLQRMKKMAKGALARGSLVSLAMLGFFWLLSNAIGSVGDTSANEKKAALEDAILRSALHCYSLEGAYPTQIDYLEENYSLTIDWDTYIVHYEIFASNLAPDVTVIVRDGGGK